jgi:hypothetical protein
LRDGFWIFVVIFFVLAPILERILKGNVNTRNPPGRLPGQRPTPQRPLPRTRFPEPTAGPAGGGREARDSTDLIPADLWEILTGQRRIEPEPSAPPPVATAPAPVPYRRPAGPPVVHDAEDDAAAELLQRRDRDWRVQHAPPAAVSLETEPLPGVARDAAFHKRRSLLSGPATVQRDRGPMNLHLDGQVALRRAMILQEVLGRPRGLDD